MIDRKTEIWNYILDNEIATEDELILVTNINGFNVDTLNDVLYSKTGYNDIEQLKEEED